MNFIEFNYPSDWNLEGWIINSTTKDKDGTGG